MRTHNGVEGPDTIGEQQVVSVQQKPAAIIPAFLVDGPQETPTRQRGSRRLHVQKETSHMYHATSSWPAKEEPIGERPAKYHIPPRPEPQGHGKAQPRASTTSLWHRLVERIKGVPYRSGPRSSACCSALLTATYNIPARKSGLKRCAVCIFIVGAL